jgi:hypothetical protein
MTKRRHQFIMIVTNYLTTFTEVRALKFSMKQEVTRFLHEQIFIQFVTPLKIVSNNGP